MTSTVESPDARATAAAEALFNEGRDVTARAVRERAGVRMTIAVAAVRAWKEAEEADRQVPDVPDELQRPLAAIWRQAHTLARAAFDAERAGLHSQVQQANDERDNLARDLETVEAERDEDRRTFDLARTEAGDDLKRTRDEAAEASKKAAEALTAERSRADRAEASLAAIEAERDRVMAERDRILAALSEAARADKED